MKSGNLNFLEPSGPLQACNGTALPLPHTIIQYSVFYYCFRAYHNFYSGKLLIFGEENKLQMFYFFDIQRTCIVIYSYNKTNEMH